MPHGWGTGDDALGRHTWFRQALRERGERYVLGVPCTTTLRDLEAPWQSVTDRRQSLDPTAWTRLMVRNGEKGPVAIEMVMHRVQRRIARKRLGSEEWLVHTRRPLSDDHTMEPRAARDATDQDTRHRYQYYLSPTSVTGTELQEPSLEKWAHVIKADACIEASFKRGKGEVGMDEYQVRTWKGWHHHMALSLLAVRLDMLPDQTVQAGECGLELAPYHDVAIGAHHGAQEAETVAPHLG